MAFSSTTMTSPTPSSRMARAASTALEVAATVTGSGAITSRTLRAVPSLATLRGVPTTGSTHAWS